MNPPSLPPLFPVRASARTLSFLLGLVCAVSLGATEAGSPAFAFRDDFSGKDGAKLHGTRPSGAPVAWQATANLVFIKADGKGAASPTGAHSFAAHVPLPPSTSGRLTVEATLKAVTQSGKQDWVALGFGNPTASEKSAVRWPEGVFVLLRPNGGYTLFLSPDGELDRLIPLKNGVLPDALSKPVPVRLVYDFGLETLGLWIDGKPIVKDYELANRNYTPRVTAAGFSGFGQQPGTASVTAFKVGIEPGR